MLDLDSLKCFSIGDISEVFFLPIFEDFKSDDLVLI